MHNKEKDQIFESMVSKNTFSAFSVFSKIFFFKKKIYKKKVLLTVVTFSNCLGVISACHHLGFESKVVLVGQLRYCCHFSQKIKLRSQNSCFVWRNGLLDPSSSLNKIV